MYTGLAASSILGVLLNEDLTAKEIVERVNKAHGKKILRQSSIYTQLARLESQGVVRGYIVDPDAPGRGGRPRVRYELTGLGEASCRGLSTILGTSHA